MLQHSLQLQSQFEYYKSSVEYEESQTQIRLQTIKEQNEEIEVLRAEFKKVTFKMDELQVTAIKFERRHEDMSKNARYV